MEAVCETWQSCLLDRWWVIGLSVLASALAIVSADYLGINRPLPFSIALGGIMSLMIMEAYPYAWLLGNATHIILWIALASMAHALPHLINGSTDTTHNAIWDHFEEVDAVQTEDERQQSQKGRSPWVEYS
jgi:hypothetical protein